MKKIETQIIFEKVGDAEAKKVACYPYPNTADCLRVICLLFKIAINPKQQKGAILIIKP